MIASVLLQIILFASAFALANIQIVHDITSHSYLFKNIMLICGSIKIYIKDGVSSNDLLFMKSSLIGL